MRGMARAKVWILLALAVLFAGEVQGQTCTGKRATGGTCVSISHGVLTNESPTLTGSTKAYYKFTSTTGTNSITFDRDTNVRVLVVGGGGAGGARAAGGGGAGAAIQTAVLMSAGVAYKIVVGPGGTGKTTSETGYGNNGQDSKITYNSDANTLVLALGGGGGGSYGGVTPNLGRDGGSGGGGNSPGNAGGAALCTNIPPPSANTNVFASEL